MYKFEYQHIRVEDIYNHPDNPRKNIGDVAELAESIKQNGLMQNLTVIPGHYNTDGKFVDGAYTVIIGHRRLAASKIAGLHVVPCVVRYLTKKEQLATMITENMQRSDLTVVEQAESMQMMIDLGDTVEQVSEKTGLSVSTVRNRIKIASLDREALRASEKRQVSIGDYMRLMEIEDESTRNIVLCTAGTKNFDRECQKAIDAQEKKKKIEKIKKELTDGGVTVVPIAGDNEKWQYNGWVGYDRAKEIIDLAKREAVLAVVDDFGGITSYTEKTKEKAEEIARVKARDEFIEKMRVRINELNDPLMERAEKFIRDYKARDKNALPILTLYAKESLMDFRPSYGEVFDIFDVPKEKRVDYNAEKAEIRELFERSQQKALLALLFSAIATKNLANTTFAYKAKKINVYQQYSKTHYLDFFRLLEEIGDFNLADEEMQFLEGTHQIYSEEFIVEESE